MNEIYERFAAGHAIIFVTPVYWYQVSSPLKLLMDRLVCADGGNPDPATTHGKKASEAKRLDLAGWDYPKHLAGRAYGLIVHGDVAGIEGSRRALTDWLDWMGFEEAGAKSRLDRFIGYYEAYATSHATLDEDYAMQKEVVNVAVAIANAVTAIRAGNLREPDENLVPPRPK
jgi:multimeric flavodoxin WrbA